MMNDEVRNAIRPAFDARSQRFRITAERVIEELGRIGFANIADYLAKDEDGRLKVDLSAITRDQAAALKQVRIETRGDSQTVHIKMSGKLSALLAMHEHLSGMPRRRKVVLGEIVEARAATGGQRPAGEPGADFDRIGFRPSDVGDHRVPGDEE